MSHAPCLPRNSIFITGPTAAGKSELALHLAERVGGEIISVDSMQVYRGLDIGTAKPSAVEQARVVHHLVDVCDLQEEFNAARFVELASAAATAIFERHKVPVFCGGTGLYFKALLEGIGEAPSGDPILRAQLAATPFESLLSELANADPKLFAKIDRQNPRRVIRAVEVLRLTGRPFSAQRARWNTENATRSAKPLVYAITRPKADLHARISDRVDTMFKRGLVDETRQLLSKGLAQNRVAMQALGYRQVSEFLQGARSLEATIELVKVRTRQFAKRQITWLNKQLEVSWIELHARCSMAQSIECILRGPSPTARNQQKSADGELC